VRVTDLTAVLLGLFATQHPADMGELYQDKTS